MTATDVMTTTTAIAAIVTVVMTIDMLGTDVAGMTGITTTIMITTVTMIADVMIIGMGAAGICAPAPKELPNC